MKKILTMLCILSLIFSIHVNKVYANDKDDGTLNLDTEEVKNKKDDHSSLTDVNGVSLFTNDFKAILQENQKVENMTEVKTRRILFSSDFKKNNTVVDSSKSDLFHQPTVFDKANSEESTNINFEPIIIVTTLILGTIVFILTKKKYKKKEGENLETNTYIYE